MSPSLFLSIVIVKERVMPNRKNLQDLFTETLKDIYFAERHILRALPKMAQQYGLLDRMTKAQFGKHMREMVMSGELVSIEVGKNPNRTPKMGLVHK